MHDFLAQEFRKRFLLHRREIVVKVGDVEDEVLVVEQVVVLLEQVDHLVVDHQHHALVFKAAVREQWEVLPKQRTATAAAVVIMWPHWRGEITHEFVETDLTHKINNSNNE